VRAAPHRPVSVARLRARRRKAFACLVVTNEHESIEHRASASTENGAATTVAGHQGKPSLARTRCAYAAIARPATRVRGVKRIALVPAANSRQSARACARTSSPHCVRARPRGEHGETMTCVKLAHLRTNDRVALRTAVMTGSSKRPASGCSGRAARVRMHPRRTPQLAGVTTREMARNGVCARARGDTGRRRSRARGRARAHTFIGDPGDGEAWRGAVMPREAGRTVA
jgi:hypothetical protein